MSNNIPLKREIRTALVQVEEQIQMLKNEAASGNYVFDTRWYQLKDISGRYLGIPLIAAKAELLNALAHLEGK